MHHLILQKADKYEVTILAKTTALTEYGLSNYYINPMKEAGISCGFLGLSAEYFGKKKPTATAIKSYCMDELLPVCRDAGTKVIYCTDGNYMKVLTKKTKVAPLFGYVVPCALPGYEDIQVVYSANHQALFMQADLQEKIDLANATTVNYLKGQYQEIGTDIIKYERYVPANPTAVAETLQELYKYDSLTVDTETFSLKHTEAGLGTIGFAWNKHEGICIDVEHVFRTRGNGSRSGVVSILESLRIFFESYKGKLIFHNASYDIKILIYKLWMKDLLDTEGLLKGLEVLTRDFDDTKIITYLATNSCAGNHLSLKDQSHEFAGNYAVDVNDITLIPNQELMRYNLIDCLCTWYVHEKHYPTMVADNQEQVYVFFKQALVNIIQMELTGMPINMMQTKKVDKQLEDIIKANWKILDNSPLMKQFIARRKEQIRDEKNAEYKKKVITSDDVQYSFNPNSNKELIYLLHDFFKFDVYKTTDSGQPAVGGKELKGHRNRANNSDISEIIDAIMKILEGDKIRNTFVAKFLEADEGPDGWHYLFGSFNLGGTKSGRLSSSNPKLLGF